MKRKITHLLLIIAVAISTIAISPTFVSAASTWVVDDDPGSDFTSIQDAVNSAASGDTIIVMPGIYEETVEIISKALTIEGADKVTTILEWTSLTSSNGFDITNTNGASISNLTVRGFRCGVHIEDSQNITVTNCILADNNGALLTDYSGIETDNSSGCVFSNNDISGNEHGVILRNFSTGNDVSNNTISGSSFGIYLNNSTYNSVQDNQINGNYYGLSLQYNANYNTLSGNTVTSNLNHGVHLEISSHNLISGNIISNNTQHGIFANTSSGYNTIEENEITNNSWKGIFIVINCSNNSIIGNLISNNTEEGIFLFQNVTYTEIYLNTIENNSIGVKLSSASNSTIYNNNFIENDVNFTSFSSGFPILNMPLPTGGNYWSDWSPPEHPDADSDGFVDDPRIFNVGIVDNYPYATPDGWAANQPPVANAGEDQTVAANTIYGADVILDGSASSDPDSDPLTYYWSWDGNTAYGVNPTILLPRGTTIITLIVNDGIEDSAPDTVEITVFADIYGLAAVIEEMYDDGLIDNLNIRDSLLDKIIAAMNKIDQGKIKPAINILEAFINHVDAQSGKSISKETATTLINDAEYIIGGLD